MSNPSQFDRLLAEDGPAALVMREPLMPVEGRDGVLFPATFAGGDGFAGGYNVDSDPSGKNVCIIDTVGSQANRMEPLFKREGYRDLVPQIVVVAGEREVNLLDAGHRAGDALLRCCSLREEIQEAFRSLLAGNAGPLAKISPTSFVFGVWDSRASQAKLARVISSTIRAFDVRVLRRGAVYVPPLDYSALEVFSETDKAKAEGDSKSPLAKRGLVHNPASGAHGGVIADGGVRRDATLQLAALRHLHQGTDADATLVLRRYILGLSMVAFTAPTESYLRQGCTLVRDPEREFEFVEVDSSGQRTPCSITHQVAREYADAVARDFGVGESRAVNFEKERAVRDLQSDEKSKSKAKATKK